MRNTKKSEINDNVIADRNLRDKYVGNYDVLEKVKELLLLPGTESMNVRQVADYYEVGKEAIEAIYTRHSNELLLDGMTNYSYKEFLNFHDASLETMKGKAVLTYSNGDVLEVPNRGLKVFPRRAILRIGMLLRDSEIAKEVRTQLLNTEEKTSDEVKTYDINEEQRLMLNVGMAYASGNIDTMLKATTEYNAFQNRHIVQLKQDNKALAGEILEWKDRKKLNAGIRMLAATTGVPFGNMWNELYKNLQYKYGICLKQRGGKPFIQWVEEYEWKNVIQTFCAMCEAYEQSPTEMFQETKSMKALSSKN